MPVQTFEDGQVELRQRILPLDVLRDFVEQPQPEQADREADGQMQAEILAAGEASGEETPEAGETLLQAAEHRGKVNRRGGLSIRPPRRDGYNDFRNSTRSRC